MYCLNTHFFHDVNLTDQVKGFAQNCCMSITWAIDRPQFSAKCSQCFPSLMQGLGRNNALYTVYVLLIDRNIAFVNPGQIIPYW